MACLRHRPPNARKYQNVFSHQKSTYAGVVELADALDSKSSVRKDVRVRPPPPAPLGNPESPVLWRLSGFSYSIQEMNFDLLREIVKDLIGGVDLGAIVQMRVNVAGGSDVAVTEPFLNVFQGYTVCI